MQLAAKILSEEKWLHVLPAESCYWAHLAADVAEDALAFQFEASLPVSVETVYVSYVCLQDKSWLACACDKKMLDGYLAKKGQKQSDLWAVCPQALPSCFADLIAENEQTKILLALNFFNGEFLSQPERHWQRILLISAAVALFLLCVVFWAGANARLQRAEQQADVYRIHGQQLLAAAFPHVQGATSLYTELEQSLRRLKQQQSGDALGAHDYPGIAHQLMSQWPQDLQCFVESIAFQGERLHIRGHVGDMETAQSLWIALRHLDAQGMQATQWQARPLQAQQQQERVVFQITLLPVQGATP